MSLCDIEYSISEAAPRVYHIEFSNRVDTALHFLRFQEYYESDCDDFFRKPFFFTDYIRWYSLNRGEGSFSYPSDWSGFNVPGFVFEKFFRDYFHEELSLDINTYDRSMRQILDKIRKEFGLKSYDWNFYLIGTTKSKENKKTLEHEIAHGLFSTNSKYKEEMLSAIQRLPSKILSESLESLAKLGYNQDVHFDEVQAYVSTGGIKTLIKNKDMLTESVALDSIREFEEIYRKYTKCQKQ